MQAGLATMGGQSPNALANIAQGAQVGFAAYGKEQEKFDKAQDRYFDIQAKLEDATRREQEAAVKYGEDSAQRVKASNQAIKLAERQEKAKFDLEALKEGAAVNLEEMRQYSPENLADVELRKAQAERYRTSGPGKLNTALEAREALDSVLAEKMKLESNVALTKLMKDPYYIDLIRQIPLLRRQHAKFSNLDTSIFDVPTTPPPTAGAKNPSERFFRPAN